MSNTRQAYSCYTCSEEVTFRGTHVRYNLDGSLHLCKPKDKLAYEKYRKYICDNTEWCLTGEDFWKWKREIYDDDYNKLRTRQRAAEAVARAFEREAESRQLIEDETFRQEHI